MTTTIPTAHPGMHPDSEISIENRVRAGVVLLVTDGPDKSRAGINVDRTKFLDAVRSELGVLIIDKADLPEVEDGSTGRIIAGVIELSRTSDPAALRDEALRYLAAAEYLEAHPPVDEQQVEALASLLPEIDESYGPLHYARALLASGKVTVQS